MHYMHWSVGRVKGLAMLRVRGVFMCENSDDEYEGDGLRGASRI